jgi:hypothetical protein
MQTKFLRKMWISPSGNFLYSIWSSQPLGLDSAKRSQKHKVSYQKWASLASIVLISFILADSTLKSSINTKTYVFYRTHLKCCLASGDTNLGTEAPESRSSHISRSTFIYNKIQSIQDTNRRNKPM